MSARGRSQAESVEHDTDGSLTSFFKSLLAGVPWSESATGVDTLTLQPPPQGIIRIHNSNGRTEIIGEDREDVAVTTEKSARAESVKAAQSLLDHIQVIAEEVGNALDLDVHIPRKWNRYGTANLQVRTPRDLRVSVSAANGKMCLTGLRGSVSVRSANGPVKICDVVGDIEVNTANAPVCCQGTYGSLIARSSNGKIELGEHSGSVEASTSNGLIRACLIQLGNAGVNLATSNGRIALELPNDVDAEVDIRVENGIIRNHREISSQSSPIAGRIRGRLGRGGPLIKLRTSNGVISLH
jgi:hypothetical protein